MLWKRLIGCNSQNSILFAKPGCCGRTGAIVVAFPPAPKNRIQPIVRVQRGMEFTKKTSSHLQLCNVRLGDGPPARLIEMDRCPKLGAANARLDVALWVLPAHRNSAPKRLAKSRRASPFIDAS
jgi:hypothetical protein